MHSAFLLTADGWRLSRNLDDVLNHSGDLVVNEDTEDQEANLVTLGAKEGQYASLNGLAVVLTPTQLHWSVDGDACLQEARQTGFALCLHTNGRYQSVTVGKGKQKRTVLTHTRPSWDDDTEEEDQHRHFVLTPVDGTGDIPGHWRLQHNPELWAEAAEVKKKLARKAELRLRTLTPSADDFRFCVVKLAKAVGVDFPKSLRVEQFWVWLAAHDATEGRKATNVLALEVARKWCHDRKRSKKWLGRYASDDAVVQTDWRLAKVCRKSQEKS